MTEPDATQPSRPAADVRPMTADEPRRGTESAPDRGSVPTAGSAGTHALPWEQQLIAELAREALVERRRARRWRIGFALVGLALAVGLGAGLLGWFRGALDTGSGLHTAVIDIDGLIQNGGEVSADAVTASLQAAYRDRSTAGIVLRINSPGGSPVQAGIIHDEIRRLRKQRPSLPVHAVIEEICASGGYYLAVAADRIYVDKASLVGSIGVLIDGFGFTGLMDKAGIERRLITAGANKGFLDSFSPLSPAQRAHAEAMLAEIHHQFIKVVRDGRGDRLRESADLFSGLVWTGERSIALGLVDDYGTVDSVARDVIKAETVVDYTRKDSLAERLARRFGAAVGAAFAGRLQVSGELRPR